MMKLRLMTSLFLLAMAGYFVNCGENVVYQEPAGTVSGNVWDVSSDYSAGVEVEVDLMVDYEDDGTYESYYETNDFSEDWEDVPSDCGTSDSNGDFNCDYVEEGEYMISITDESDEYNDVDYVIETFFSDELESDGTFAEDAPIEYPLGVTGATDRTDSVISDTMHRIVLSWGDTSDFDAYWSFPRMDFNDLQDDVTSPFYPDHIAGINSFDEAERRTLPYFCNENSSDCGNPEQGTPIDVVDNDTDGPGDGTNKFRFLSDLDSLATSEEDANNGIDPDANYDEATDGQISRAMMYWNWDGDQYFNGAGLNAENPFTYSVDDGSGGDLVVVGMDRDSFSGEAGPETIFLNGSPTTNYLRLTPENMLPAEGNAFGLSTGDEYALGIGQYTVGFYANSSNATNPSPRFNSSFATSKTSVSIYSPDGERLWTFTVPEGNAQAGQTLPMRNWRPFHGVYMIENEDGDDSYEENIQFVPAGFDNTLAYRNGLEGVKVNLNTRTRNR